MGVHTLGRPPGPYEPVMIQIERVCQFKQKPNRGIGCARCGKYKKDPDHMGAPPSMNVAFGSGSQRAFQTEKHKWQDLFVAKLREARMPSCGRVVVEGEVCFPTRARRDQGNHRFIIEKALGDALVAGGWLPDDSWEEYQFGGLTWSYEAGRSSTRLILFPSAATEMAA